MTAITFSELSRLADYDDGHAVSLYFPIYTGADSRQNPVRLKNLVREAEGRLVQAGLTDAEAKQRIAPARELIDHPLFWEELGQGQAVLLGDRLQTWRLPLECPELCVVGTRFHLTPLVHWLGYSLPYYVIAVSQNMVKLYQGSHNQVEDVTPAEFPSGLDDALRLDPRDAALNATIGRAQVPGKSDLLYHGHGGLPDAAKDGLLQYFRVIDRALGSTLAGHTEPLLFAGVDYLFPIYQEANSYPHLYPRPIAGNPELLSPIDLRDRAWPLIEAMLERRRERELAKYWTLVAQGRTSNDLEAILQAAYAGAVETLFLDPALQQPGRFDRDRNVVRIDDPPRDDSEELLNLAAVLVLRNRGQVEVLPSGNVPGGGACAAVFRYPYPPAGEAIHTAAPSQNVL